MVLCLVAGAITAWRVDRVPSIDSTGKAIQENLTHLIAQVNQEADVQIRRVRQNKPLKASTHQFLVTNDEKILLWSDNHFIPPFYTLSGSFDAKYLKLSSYDFIVKRWPIDSNRNLIVVIPLHIRYKIVNDYLTPFVETSILGKGNVFILQPEAAQGYPVSASGQVLFRVYPVDSPDANSVMVVCTIAFFVLAFVFLVVLLTRLYRALSGNYPVWSFFGLLFAAVGVRAVMIVAQFPLRFHTLYLFDPKDFASSQWNPSMGDMLLNAVLLLLFCFLLFKNVSRFLGDRYVNRWLVMVFSAMAIFFTMLYPFVVTQTIYNNSEITLSISQSLDFDFLRISALLLVAISWVSTFLFVHVCVKILTRDENIFQISISIVSGCLLFAGINEFTGQVYFWPTVVAVAYLIIVLSFTVYHALDRFQYATFVYFFLAVVCFSVVCTVSVTHFERLRKARDQHRFADNFLVERDYLGEYLMNESADKIAKDALIQSRLSNPLLSKEVIRHKISQVLLSGYFNRYTVTITLYDQSGVPLSDEIDTLKLQKLQKQYDVQAYRTDYKNVFYVGGHDNGSAKKYVVVVPVRRNDFIAGYVSLQFYLKRIIPENVYPELLVDNRFTTGHRSHNLTYAVVSDAKIEYSAGNFNYENFIKQELANTNLYSQGIVRDGYWHVGVEDVSGRVAIVSSVALPFIYRLADFSFFVLVGIACVLIFLLIQGVVHYSGSGNLFLAARIQLILNLAFFVPLIAVCLITLGLTAKSSRGQLKDDYLTKSNQFAKTVALTMMVYGSADQAEFENEFKEITTLANLDANLYSMEGTLLTTSQPLIFENQMLSTYLDPGVFQRMLRGETMFIASDYVGSLDFYVAYSKILSPENGEPLGILGIPFFQSEASLSRMQITVLANIISIFTLIFIVLLIVSFFVTKWLTAPLAMITQTFGSISLTNLNKPLAWKSDDEIGLMVREYNHMLDTLSASKSELEKNQREKAWREIAQQVAHEIKNPLTPMKLTLQQLERTLQHEQQSNEKLKRSITSLLEQINSLDGLASSFSSFAKMPEPVMKPLELVALLTKVVNLHVQEAEITFQADVNEAPVFADDQLLGRIVSNIILNGIQAVPNGKPPVIRVRLSANAPYYSVYITDNGTGIGVELQEKIFLPHFTTKKTGSGLGLAIARQGIEQMGGRISFSTSPNGTVFKIELPQNINT